MKAMPLNQGSLQTPLICLYPLFLKVITTRPLQNCIKPAFMSFLPPIRTFEGRLQRESSIDFMVPHLREDSA